MGRAPCCDKANVKRGPWSPEEDDKLKSYIQNCGTGGNWIALPPKIGLKRCGKSCRLRWLNYLRPNLKHGGFTDDEDNLICTLYLTIGSRWSIIAGQLPGRTDNDIKNYWNTTLKKKLIARQRRQMKKLPQNYSICALHMNQPMPTLPCNYLQTTPNTHFLYTSLNVEDHQQLFANPVIYPSASTSHVGGDFQVDNVLDMSYEIWERNSAFLDHPTILGTSE